MDKRYYLLLVFQGGKKDKLEPYGEDLSKASDIFDAMRQKGGPEGIVAAIIIVSTGRVLKHSKIYPKSWHEEHAKSIRDQSAPALESTSDAPAPETPEQEAERLLQERSGIDSRLAELGVVVGKGHGSEDGSKPAGDPPASGATGDKDAGGKPIQESLV